jgi:hypothetical protein
MKGWWVGIKKVWTDASAHTHTHTHTVYPKFYLFTQLQYLPTMKCGLYFPFYPGLASILYFKMMKNVIHQLLENKYLAAGTYFKLLISLEYCFSMKTCQKHWSLHVFLLLHPCCHIGYPFLHFGVGAAEHKHCLLYFPWLYGLWRALLFSGVISLPLLQTKPTY